MMLPLEKQLEQELLLSCARTSLDPVAMKRVSSLVQKDIDWEYVKRSAHAHGVLPLLYRTLKAACPAEVPRNVLDELKRRFYTNDLKNRFMSRELIRLLGILQSNGIPAIPYKGPTLAVMAYRDVGLRKFGDLDVVIPKKELLKTKGILISRGYKLSPATANESYIKENYEYLFTSHSEQVQVDIHWAFTRRHWPLPVHLERLWRRVEPLQLEGKTVHSFHPEDLLLILCIHGAKHYWERLGWICDIAELIREKENIDWQQVADQAVQMRSVRPLLLGLDLARKLLGAVVPKEIGLKIDADPSVSILSANVREFLFQRVKSPAMLLREDFSRIRMRESWRDKVPIGLHILRKLFHQRLKPNSKDEDILRLPRSLYWVYYLIRPIRLINQCLRYSPEGLANHPADKSKKRV